MIDNKKYNSIDIEELAEKWGIPIFEASYRVQNHLFDLGYSWNGERVLKNQTFTQYIVFEENYNLTDSILGTTDFLKPLKQSLPIEYFLESNIIFNDKYPYYYFKTMIDFFNTKTTDHDILLQHLKLIPFLYCEPRAKPEAISDYDWLSVLFEYNAFKLSKFNFKQEEDLNNLSQWIEFATGMDIKTMWGLFELNGLERDNGNIEKKVNAILNYKKQYSIGNTTEITLGL